MKIIVETVSLANMSPLSDQELEDRAADWVKGLFGTVPEPWLDRCLRNAIHEHKGSFPINFYEINEAYKRLIAMGHAKPATQNENAHSVERVGECERCYNTGREHIFDQSGLKILGVKGSGTCDHRTPLQGEGLWYRIQLRKQNLHNIVQFIPEPVVEKLWPGLLAKIAEVKNESNVRLISD